MNMQQPPPSGYGAPPPPPSQPGYGPPPGYYAQPGYGPPGYGPGYPPPKKGMSTGMIVLIVFGCLFGGCVMCGVIGSAGNKNKQSTADTKPTAAAATVDPSAVAAAAKAAADAKEKNAVDTFPTKKIEITTKIAKAKTQADQAKWGAADTDLSSAETALENFKGTSIADSKDYQQLDDKASALRKKIDPQVKKAAQAAAAAAEEADLKAKYMAVSSSQLFNDYQANEVSADNKYKGKMLLVTGTVASIDKGPFGGLILRLATPNEFMSAMADMEKSEQGQLAQLNKGDRVRVLCKGTGMTLGSPSLDDCVFK